MKISIDSNAKGNYILLIAVPQELSVEVGALGLLTFPQGYYAYCGSAMGGLVARISRHIRRKKKIRWHIDYLLKQGMIKAVLSAETNERLECQLADGLRQKFDNYLGFGSSDCSCPSHLFFAEELSVLQEKSVEVFRGLLEGGELMIDEY